MNIFVYYSHIIVRPFYTIMEKLEVLSLILISNFALYICTNAYIYLNIFKFCIAVKAKEMVEGGYRIGATLGVCARSGAEHNTTILLVTFIYKLRIITICIYIYSVYYTDIILYHYINTTIVTICCTFNSTCHP